MDEKLNKIVIISGPTATGKTSLAIELHKRFPQCEIVNFDSLCFYKELAIGTAKPTKDEQRQRKRIRYHNPSNTSRATHQHRLTGITAFQAIIACALPPLFGFLIPFIQLSIWGLETASTMVDKQFWELAMNSFVLAASAAIVTLIVATILAYGKRTTDNYFIKWLINLCAMGYAVPGIIIAVGTLGVVLVLFVYLI